MLERRSRYEPLPKQRGIVRVHTRSCSLLTGKRCNCESGYRAEVFDRVTGRRQYRTFPSLQAASRWRADMRTAIQSGRARITEVPSIKDAWHEFYAGISAGMIKTRGGSDYKPGVVRAYKGKFENHLLPRFGGSPINDIRLVHVQALVDQLVASGAQPQTVRNTVTPLRAFYRWCIRREWATVNPCDNVQLPTGEDARDRIASVAEAIKLIEAVPERDRAIWATAFFVGLRRGELMALRCEDIDLKARCISVWRSYDPGARAFVVPKTKKGIRKVGMPKVLIPYIARHLLRTGHKEGLVFAPVGDVPFNDTDLRERARKAWHAAGLEPIGLHECRHTYASLMIDAGLNIKKISEYMGHASVTITLDRYGHLLPGDRESTTAQFDAYLDKALRPPGA